MGQIVLLDDLTINKIAAGEVVDRPASIVKELVENSIDAGAKNIQVEIRNGGITYIKVKDDGCGFKSDDVEIAFERHATSKIRSEEDIQKVMSMGFRGEALASVAAISNVELITKNENEDIGTKTVVEAGNILLSEQNASPKGTTIIVKNIFFNVPARYKFLKKDYTEAGYIEEAVTKLALVHPEISFKYINNGKQVISTVGNGDLKTVIYNIFGKESAQNLIYVDSEYNKIKVQGVIGTPKNVRSNRSHQYFYVNSRYVKNRTLSVALDEGYTQNIAIGKFAFCVLNIKVPPEVVDVNVHPAKLEVKFENESIIYSAMYNAVKSAILKYNTENSPFAVKSEDAKEENKVKSIITEIKKEEYVPEVYENTSILNKVIKNLDEIEKINVQNPSIQKVNEVKENIQIINNQVENIHVQSIQEENAKKENIQPEIIQTSNIAETPIFTPIEVISEKEETIIPKEKAEQAVIEEIHEEIVEDVEKPKYEIAYKYIGTIFNTYPIVEIGDKMYIVDQHAAHERLLYEKVKEIYYSKDKQTQMLLLPILIELTSYEMSVYLENKEYFENAGFMIESFGDNALKIVGVPNINYEINYDKMFLDLLDEVNGTNKTEKREKEERFLATVACKAAIKANTCYTDMEYKYLIDEMMKLDRPFTCPHGRPTAQEMSKYEIERKFLRK